VERTYPHLAIVNHAIESRTTGTHPCGNSTTLEHIRFFFREFLIQRFALSRFPRRRAESVGFAPRLEWIYDVVAVFFWYLLVVDASPVA
jgi:hypothetical protein